MSIGAILVGIAITLMTIPIVIKPFLNNKLIGSRNPVDTRLDNPGDCHSELLMALRDLDFDHQIGKVTEEDYGALRETLLVQAAIALETREKWEAEQDERLEEAIRLRREKQSSSRACRKCGATLEVSDRFCRACGNPIEATCLKCGEKMRPNDLYCNSCGTKMPEVKMVPPMESAQ